VLTNDDLLDVLNARVVAAGSQQRVASDLGVSPQYLNDVIRFRRPVGPFLADAMGYRRVTMFVPLAGSEA
jgi:DNA-binding transcriptional regulator YdaS (Cro superfamily)